MDDDTARPFENAGLRHLSECARVTPYMLLLAIRLPRRIHRALDIDLTVHRLFQRPAVIGLALVASDKLVMGTGEASGPRWSDKP
jgi:hypothetical protein